MPISNHTLYRILFAFVIVGLLIASFILFADDDTATCDVRLDKANTTKKLLLAAYILTATGASIDMGWSLWEKLVDV